MKNFRSYAIGNIDHGSRSEFVCGKKLDHIFTRFGFQLPAYQVSLVFQVGLDRRVGEVELLFPFQDLQTQVGRPYITADAKQVANPGGIAVGDLFGGTLANRCHADDQSFLGGGGVATNEIHLVVFAGSINAFVQFLDSFNGEAV